ncbi:MAG: hypothetical protein ABIK89_06230, partial [Planctomycetota bacterium]
SIHDPCKVRAVVFDDGKKRVALVGLDAGFIWREPVQAVRKEIHAKCGIPPEAVLIGASHSHSSGPLGIVQPGEYDHASPFVRSLAYEKSACADAGYLQRVQQAIVATVCRADRCRAEARLGVGTGVEDKVAFNRRLRMKSGVTYTHPGQGNPGSVDYAGPTDPKVGVLGAWDTKGKFLGCVVNFACHATTSPGGISANYIYYLEQTIRGCMGSGAIVVFLQGASGDVTQVDNLSRHVRRRGEQDARFVGGRIGAEAVKVLLTMAPGTLVPLDARSKVLPLKRRVPKPERVQRCYELVKQDLKKVGHTQWVFAKEIVLLDALLAKEPVVDVEVQAIQVGPAIFLANPAELFCQLGLEIRAKSPFPFTFPVGYANGFVAYVPTEEAFGPHGGGYETRLTSVTNLEPTAGRRIVEASLDLAGEMTPGEVPTLPKAPPFRPRPGSRPVPPELD